MDRKTIDAEFEVIEPRGRFSWGSALWWAVYVSGFCYAAYHATDPSERVVAVIGAALIAPFGLMLSAFRKPSSEQEVRLLRQRLAGRWGKAAKSEVSRQR